MKVDRLILNFDINGTLILQDSSKGLPDEYMVLSLLAETTFAKWDDHHEVMSFKDYAYKVLVPGDKSHPQLKKERQKVIGCFLTWLTEQSHASKDQVHAEYQKIKAKMTSSVFSSFYAMLDKLRQMEIPFTIILRTFGTDLPEVVNEIENHPSGLKITKWAKFENNQLHLEQQTVEKVEEIFQLFASSQEHFAIQDDWKRWNQDGEKGRSGKPFLYDNSGQTLSLFFDDNITGEELDIVNPCEISGQNIPPKDLKERLIFQVDTKQALLDDNYYTNLVLSAL